MNLRDTAERVVNSAAVFIVTGLVAWLAETVGLDLSDLAAELQAALALLLFTALSAAWVWVRRHAPWLPNPGDGLPGLPT